MMGAPSCEALVRGLQHARTCNAAIAGVKVPTQQRLSRAAILLHGFQETISRTGTSRLVSRTGQRSNKKCEPHSARVYFFSLYFQNSKSQQEKVQLWQIYILLIPSQLQKFVMHTPLDTCTPNIVHQLLTPDAVTPIR